MDFAKLVPWNWFKKEEGESVNIVPVQHDIDKSKLSLSMHDIQTEFEHLFDSFKRNLNIGLPDTSLLKTDWFKPSLDVSSDDKEYSVKIELPGMESSDISIEYTDNILTVKGEKRQETEEKNKNFYRIERSYGSFMRTLDLPEDTDAENITSSYKNGVLSINMPRKMLPKKDTKKIEIQSGS